jgi:hypothetical protein
MSRKISQGEDTTNRAVPRKLWSGMDYGQEHGRYLRSMGKRRCPWMDLDSIFEPKTCSTLLSTADLKDHFEVFILSGKKIFELQFLQEVILFSMTISPIKA